MFDFDLCACSKADAFSHTELQQQEISKIKATFWLQTIQHISAAKPLHYFLGSGSKSNPELATLGTFRNGLLWDKLTVPAGSLT